MSLSKNYLVSDNSAVKNCRRLALISPEGLGALDPSVQQWATQCNFTAIAETILIIPTDIVSDVDILIGVETTKPGLWTLGSIVGILPAGQYRLVGQGDEESLYLMALGWCLGQYQFDRYKSNAVSLAPKCLALPDMIDIHRILAESEATDLVRDLVNTPAEDMGPDALEKSAETLAAEFDASLTVIKGDDLLNTGFPAIHAVGRAAASPREPRLIDLSWVSNDHSGDALPTLTIIGKGVAFDSGGLNIKGAAGMRIMKKDMGGAAHAMGLALFIMRQNLPVKLRLLVPAVENAIAGNAFRPGDILQTRQGLTVEVGNTDAEGRLILCDALTYASESKPDLILDYATLTGAARVALGPEIPPVFTRQDDLWEGLAGSAETVCDPIWRLPLYEPYQQLLESPIADLCNISDTSFAGSIIAGLYLSRFIPDDQPWAHFDVYAWRPKKQPGRAFGGEAQSLRASAFYIEQWIKSTKT